MKHFDLYSILLARHLILWTGNCKCAPLERLVGINRLMLFPRAIETDKTKKQS